MKRTGSNNRKSKIARVSSVYNGYVIAQGDVVATVSDMSGFYDKYVAGRVPVKITCKGPVDVERFRVKNIVKTLNYEAPLQVERKYKFGFGLGSARQLMTMETIVDQLSSGDDSYYLTTQYDEHDIEGAESTENAEDMEEGMHESDSDEELNGLDNELNVFSNTAGMDDDLDSDSFDQTDLKDDFDDEDFPEDEYVDETNSLTADDIEYRVRTLYQPPLTNLVHDAEFPVAPSPFQNLVTQQINLWMGSSCATTSRPDLLHPTKETLGKYVPAGNSSGLHHDHADNLYVLVEGRKRFTLYSPADAYHLHTVGNINKVYGNGLIDYKVDRFAPHWRHMREDGAIVAEHARWLLENKDFSTFTEDQLMDAVENEEEYNAGKGKEKEENDNEENGNEENGNTRLDPPSFSRIPPILAHLDELSDPAEIEALTKFANEHFPGFLQLHKMEVWLEPGDMLYVPCGWFHEVTSVASENVHIALNWWFMPPVTPNADKPYLDEYWRADFAKTLGAIEHEQASNRRW